MHEKQSLRAPKLALILAPLWVLSLSTTNAQSGRTMNLPQRPAPSSSSSSAMKQFRLPTPIAETPVPIVDASGEGAQILSFITPGTNFERNAVKDAPFWARSLTEHIQTLPDGNRVIQKSTSHIYRDGAGRTRREHDLTDTGESAPNGELARLVVINDPIARVNYKLESPGDLGRKKILPPGEVSQSTERALGINAPFRVMMPRGAARRRAAEGETLSQPMKTEKVRLEPQLIDGVTAEGTSIVVTIPGDRFQNGQAVVITHEEWYAPELRMIVLMKHNDPRFGETTFRLTNITRGEPLPALFQLPQGYRVIDEPEPRDDGRQPPLLNRP